MAYTDQPGFLNDDQIASVQATVLSSLPWRCDVLEKHVGSRDATGREVITWPVLASYNCDIENARVHDEDRTAEKVTGDMEYIVTLPFDAVINLANRLQITTDFGTFIYEIRNRAENWTDQDSIVVTARRVE